MFSTAAISLTLTLLLNLVDQEYIEHSNQNLKETNSCASLLTNLSTETSILNVGNNSFPGPFNNYHEDFRNTGLWSVILAYRKIPTTEESRNYLTWKKALFDDQSLIKSLLRLTECV